MKRRGVTLLELLVASAVIAFALVASIKAIAVARSIADRNEILTRLTLRAHSEIEARMAAPFGELETGTFELAGFEDPRTTGAVTIVREPDSPAVRIEADLVTRTPRGAQSVALSALRFPEATP